MRRIADLMVPAPATWGLRGDPVLWALLVERLAHRPLPGTATALRAILETEFATLTGHALVGAADRLDVPATLRENGGMSQGQVSAPFWRETAIPLILSRHVAGPA